MVPRNRVLGSVNSRNLLLKRVKTACFKVVRLYDTMVNRSLQFFHVDARSLTKQWQHYTCAKWKTGLKDRCVGAPTDYVPVSFSPYLYQMRYCAVTHAERCT